VVVHGSPASLYTLVMTDPDAPSPDNPAHRGTTNSMGSVRHVRWSFHLVLAKRRCQPSALVTDRRVYVPVPPRLPGRGSSRRPPFQSGKPPPPPVMMPPCAGRLGHLITWLPGRLQASLAGGGHPGRRRGGHPGPNARGLRRAHPATGQPPVTSDLTADIARGDMADVARMVGLFLVSATCAGMC
jgi:hypothetical protein